MKYRLSTDLCESLIQSDWFLGLSGSVSLSLLCCCCVRNETSVGAGEHFGSEVGRRSAVHGQLTHSKRKICEWFASGWAPAGALIHSHFGASS